MPSTLTYNNVEMHNVLFRRFEQRMEYDPSRTDVIFCRFTIACEGIIHSQGTTFTSANWIAQQGAGSSPSTLPAPQPLLVFIQQSLWQPRCQLTINMGGNPVFLCQPPGNMPNSDVDNGPKPKAVVLTHITSNAIVGPTYHCEFEIECATLLCPQTSSNLMSPILDNRWSIAERLDDEYFTTRTIHGSMRASNQTINPDAYRYLLVPTLEQGFKRDSIDFNLQTDGLTVDYVVVDKQVHTAAPWPAVKIDVMHSEGTGNGGDFESECRVNLSGHPGADKLALFSLAVRIIEDRLGKISDLGKDTAKVPAAFMMIDQIGERNHISVMLKLRHNLGTIEGIINPGNYYGCPIGKLGRPLNFAPLGTFGTVNYPNAYNPMVSGVPGPWGYYSNCIAGTGSGEVLRTSQLVALMMLCYTQYPCMSTLQHFMQHGVIVPIQQPRTPVTIPPGTSGNNTTNQGQPPGYQGSGQGGYVSPGTTAAGSGASGTSTTTSTTSGNITVNINVAVPPFAPPDANQLPSLANTGGKNILYTFATAETKLNLNPMRVQLAVGMNPRFAQPGANTCVIATLGLTQATLTFHIEYESATQWPAMLEPIPFWQAQNVQTTAPTKGGTVPPAGPGIMGTLIDAQITPSPPTNDPTRTKPVYHVSARYIYALNRPPTRSETIPIGVLPFTTLTAAQTQLQLQTLYSADPVQGSVLKAAPNVVSQGALPSAGTPAGLCPNAGGY
jgi:hypothetical protein